MDIQYWFLSTIHWFWLTKLGNYIEGNKCWSKESSFGFFLLRLDLGDFLLTRVWAMANLMCSYTGARQKWFARWVRGRGRCWRWLIASLQVSDCLCAGIQACLLVKDMCSSIEEHLAVVSTMESVNLLMKLCMTKLTTLQVAGFLL